jgi:hypothetical protein
MSLPKLNERKINAKSDNQRFSSHGGCVADVRFGATTHRSSSEVLHPVDASQIPSAEGYTQSEGTEETHQCQMRETIR